MSQSLTKIYIHLTFGTKNRYPFITEKVELKLHSYLSEILENLGCPVLKINSVPDHIHILFRLSKKQALAKIIEIIKKESSKWLKMQGINQFYWQLGYGAFSVSPAKIEIVKKYIETQKEHHKKKSFKEELEEFFKESKILEYDPVYFWK
jgi:REP-associated tyrosine transposase